MGRARLERTGDKVLSRARCKTDGRMDCVSINARGDRKAGRKVAHASGLWTRVSHLDAHLRAPERLRARAGAGVGVTWRRKIPRSRTTHFSAIHRLARW